MPMLDLSKIPLNLETFTFAVIAIDNYNPNKSVLETCISSYVDACLFGALSGYLAKFINTCINPLITSDGTSRSLLRSVESVLISMQLLSATDMNPLSNLFKFDLSKESIFVKLMILNAIHYASKDLTPDNSTDEGDPLHEEVHYSTNTYI